MRAGRGIGADWGLGVEKAKSVVGGLVVVLVLVVGISWLVRGCQAKIHADAAPIEAYFAAVRTGDSAAACALLTDAARAKLMTEQQAPTCEAAADALAEGLTAEDRDQLAKPVKVRQYAASQSRKEFELAKAPLGTEVYIITNNQITDWGWNAHKLLD
jgi:hypothetical protein